MRVKLTQPVSGLFGTYRTGSTVDLPRGKAVRLIESGRAEPVVTPRVERAIVTEVLEVRDAD
jgi:hypothetical protein